MRNGLLSLVTVVACVSIAAPAFAGVEVEGTGEPAFTNSAQNTQWIRWDGGPGTDAYRIDPSYYRDNALVTSSSHEVPVSGTSWINWSGVATLQHGGQYGICTQGRFSFPNDSLFFPDGPNSCTHGDMVGKRSYTTIDRSKPAISVAVGGGGAATNSSIVSLHIDFTDDVAGPYPGNFVCVEPGSGASCAGIYAYSPECSVPNATGKVNSFDCQIGIEGSAIPDGPVKFCAIAADAAIPDNPNSADQTGTADKANLSTGTCDTILVDRVAPSASIAPTATAVTVGQLVGLTGSASDAGSGLGAERAWTFGDGSASVAGDSAYHSYSQPGAYTVEWRVTDAAGNEKVVSTVITVKAASTDEDSGGGGSTDGGTTGGAGDAGDSPSGKALSVVAPKRVKLTPGRRSIAIRVTTGQPGRLSMQLLKGRRRHARSAALLSAGTSTQRLRLPKGLRPGRHVLKVAFTPRGAKKAVSRKLTIAFVAANKKAKKATAARATRRPRLDVATVPAPSLPNGKLAGQTDRRLELR